ncbi:hypothetical protein KA078_02650 [Candidatus Woesebacteria bacterium]|nr:hypothetical protein [Candidatus Woesebacteria bacterium]
MIALNYIKKEDAHYFISQRYKLLGVIYTAFAAVLAAEYWFVIPKLENLFLEFNLDVPIQFVLAPWFIAFAICISLAISVYYFSKKVDASNLQQRLKEYKPNEMIRIDKIISMREVYFALFYFLILFILFVSAVIQPIYSLTADL